MSQKGIAGETPGVDNFQFFLSNAEGRSEMQQLVSRLPLPVKQSRLCLMVGRAGIVQTQRDRDCCRCSEDLGQYGQLTRIEPDEAVHPDLGPGQQGRMRNLFGKQGQIIFRIGIPSRQKLIKTFVEQR